MLATRTKPAAPPAFADVKSEARGSRFLGGLGAGLLVLALAVPVALLVAWCHRHWTDPAKAVTVVVLLFGIITPIPPVLYFALQRGAATLEGCARVLLLTLVTLIAGITLYVLGTEVFFPGDFLVWSESDFVNDILKLRIGYPIYSAQANSESFFYPPGAQVITYLISALVAHPASIVTYRMIQIGYTVGTAALGAACVRDLLYLTNPNRSPRTVNAWVTLSVPVLFLAATNWLTNAYVQNLHNDALAQLTCVFAFWQLLRYASTRSLMTLGVLALVPAFGFFVKQSLLIILPLTGLYVLVFDKPRSIWRALIYGLCGGAAVALVYGAGRLLWGDSFQYWLFYTLSKHAISPLRSIQHVLDAWAYFAFVFVGGIGLLRAEHDRRLFGLWLVALLLLTTEAYTSGAAWMLNHMGPGSSLAAVWFLAAAGAYWSAGSLWPSGRATSFDYLRGALVVVVALFVLIGMSAVRIPMPAVSKDAHRYVHEIEREFQGVPADRVLLDVGTFVYLPGRVVMKDRAASIGERGYSNTGDFSQTLDRLRRKQYARILVREPFAPDSWYDHDDWPVSSGIRAALRANYREVRTIAEVKDDLGHRTGRYTFRTISVLEPK